MKRPAISRIRYVDAASEVIDGVAVPAAAARLDLALGPAIERITVPENLSNKFSSKALFGVEAKVFFARVLMVWKGGRVV